MPAFRVPDNLAFDNYADLAEAIQDWLDRSDLSGSVQAMIALAESEIRLALNPLPFETSAEVTTVNGAGVLPSDCWLVNRVTYNGETLPLYSANAGPLVVGERPYAYSIEGGGIRLWPAGAYTVTLQYQQSIPQLSENTPSNDLLSRFPNIYFFGAMVFAEGYVANDERAASFRALFDSSLEAARRYFTRAKFPGVLVPRVAFVP